jgi:ABC-type nitrate/sulfonate/bicarbonate transport system substrate-binding protein
MNHDLGALLRGTVFAVGLSLAAGSASADPLNLRVAWATTPSQLTPLFPLLAKAHPEIVPHFGKSYTLEAIHSAGSPTQITALASGALDVGSLGPSSLALAIVNAHLEMRIIGGVLYDGEPGHFSAYYTVKKDGPIKRIGDMKGHRAGINALGSPVWMELHIVLQRHGLTDKDYVTIETPFPTMFAMMQENKVDVVPVINPVMGEQFDATGEYRVLFNTSKELGPSQAQLWAARADFVAAHRAVLVDFLEDQIRGARWFLNPAHHEEAIAIAEQMTKLPKERLDYAFTNRDVGRSRDFTPDVKAIQNEIDDALELKLLPKAVTIAPHYVDVSLLNEAKARVDRK